MSKPQVSILDRSLAAASQGAAGAIIGALLSSVTDPVTNRILVKRATLSQALSELQLSYCIKYFQTVLPTNFIKFPLFEILNELLSGAGALPPFWRSIVMGVVFTTSTLPLTNYRYCKSVNEEVNWSSPKLWTAYLPTVVRDVIYANARTMMTEYMSAKYPELKNSAGGRAIAMFATVVVACVVSSPGNEWRGYVLQPEGKRKSPAEFFQLPRYVRSTFVGALVMGLSMGIATVVTGPAQSIIQIAKKKYQENPLVAVFLMAAVAYAVLHSKKSPCDWNECMSKFCGKENQNTSGNSKPKDPPSAGGPSKAQ